MNKIFNLLALALFVAMLSSCSAPKKVPYLVDAETLSPETLSNFSAINDPTIAPGDLLNIEVTSPDPAAVAPFNRGRYVDPTGRIGIIARSNTSTTQTGAEAITDYYLVNADGNIDFPVIGKIQVAGLSKQQVADKILAAIYPRYISERPGIDIRLMNFHVTVAGAVKSPGVFRSNNERMTFLEAISMAGDLDIKGDRENILLYRLNPDGTREVHRVNIHDKNFLMSPYFNLQQNDFIYVEPNKSMKSQAWQLNPSVSATITIIGGLSSLASLIIGIVNLSK